jgi:hypothetical protein
MLLRGPLTNNTGTVSYYLLKGKRSANFFGFLWKTDVLVPYSIYSLDLPANIQNAIVIPL